MQSSLEADGQRIWRPNRIEVLNLSTRLDGRVSKDRLCYTGSVFIGLNLITFRKERIIFLKSSDSEFATGRLNFSSYFL
jgi:hypothetical protein